MSHVDISRELGILRSTISNFLHRLDERGSNENLHRTGRPRASSDTHDRYIARKALSNPRVPLTELPDIMNTDLSVSTIRR